MNDSRTPTGSAQPHAPQSRDSGGNNPLQDRVAALEAAVAKRRKIEVDMWMRADVDIEDPTGAGLKEIAGIHKELVLAYRRAAAFRTRRAKIVLGVITALAISSITMLAQYIPHQVFTWLVSPPKP